MARPVVQRVRISLWPWQPDIIETSLHRTAELNRWAKKAEAASHSEIAEKIRQAVSKGDCLKGNPPQSVTPLFRGAHYKDRRMKRSYTSTFKVGSPLLSSATSGKKKPYITKFVKSWGDLAKIKEKSRFPVSLRRHHHKGQNLYLTLGNLYVNDYNRFATVMPDVLRAFPALKTDKNPFLSLSERAHISHGYAQHEGKKDKSQINNLGGLLHGLAVPVSFQQSQSLWINIPSLHATGDMTIKVRHLSQAEHIGFHQIPAEYHIKSWEVEAGSNEKEMERKAVFEGAIRRTSLVKAIEDRGDIPAYPRKSIFTGASHLYFDAPPFTTDLERKQGSRFFSSIYESKNKLQRRLKEQITKFMEFDGKYDAAAEGSEEGSIHYLQAQEEASEIERNYSEYKKLCIQLMQLEGQEKFPPRIRREQRFHPYQSRTSLYSEEELVERDKYHNPEEKMLLRVPMKEIRHFVEGYLRSSKYYLEGSAQ
jgi:hypothetical protein